jgi:hypothetical protein
LIQAGLLYFPGWTATIDGMKGPQEIASGTGDMQVRVPAGNHRLDLALGRTPTRFYGELLSFVAFLTALGLLLRTPPVASESSDAAVQYPGTFHTAIKRSHSFVMERIHRLPWHGNGLIIAIAAASIVPLWVTPMVPTQDGPTHLYNAWVVAHLNDPALRLDTHFRIVWFLPYWGNVAPLVGFVKLVDPLIAEKLFLSIVVLLFSCGVAWLTAKSGGDVLVAACVGAILAHGFLFAVGLSAYILAVGAGLVFGAWGIAPKGASALPGTPRLVIATLGLAIIFFIHPFAAPIACMLWLVAGLCVAVQRRSLTRDLMITYGLPVLVACMVALTFILTRRVPPGSEPTYREDALRWIDRLGFFVQGSFWSAYRPADTLIGVALLALVTLLLIVRSRAESNRSFPALAFLILAAGSFFFYLVLPWHFLSASVVPDRLAPLAIVFVLPWATGGAFHGRTVWRAAFVILLLGAVGIRAAEYRDYGNESLEIVRCDDGLRPGSVFVVADRSFRGNPVDPLFHSWARLAIARQAVALDDFMAELPGVYPVTFTEATAQLARQARFDKGAHPPSGVSIVTCGR